MTNKQESLSPKGNSRSLFTPDLEGMKELMGINEAGRHRDEALTIARGLDELCLMADNGRIGFFGRRLRPADTHIIVMTKHDPKVIRDEILEYYWKLNDGVAGERVFGSMVGVRGKSKLLLVDSALSRYGRSDGGSGTYGQETVTRFCNMMSSSSPHGRRLITGGDGDWGEQGLGTVPVRLILGQGVWEYLERYQGPTSGPQLELESLLGRQRGTGMFSVYQVDQKTKRLALFSWSNFVPKCRPI